MRSSGVMGGLHDRWSGLGLNIRQLPDLGYMGCMGFWRDAVPGVRGWGYRGHPGRLRRNHRWIMLSVQFAVRYGFRDLKSRPRFNA